MKTVVIKKTSNGYVAIPKGETNFCPEHGDCLYQMSPADWENYRSVYSEYHDIQNFLQKKRHEAALKAPNLKYQNLFNY